MDRIVLIGFRGTGKTATGSILARRLRLPFIDTDNLIEKQAGKPVGDIFAEDGESVFREIEASVVDTLPCAPCVISCGGGTVINYRGVYGLRQGSTMVLLTAQPATIHERISGSSRPALTALTEADEINHLLSERRAQYCGAADFCIATDDKSPEMVADEIIRRLFGGRVSDEKQREALVIIDGMSVPEDTKADLRRRVTVRKRHPAKRLCAIAGNPCMHSKSPQVFNRLFRDFGIRYHYTFFEYSSAEAILNLAEILELKGMSVTIPFKEDIMEHLNRVSEDAAAIGAANTIVWCGDERQGYNTDWLGIKRPLEATCLDFNGDSAVVLGAGGAARAAVYALQNLGLNVVIVNRNREKAKSLAAEFACDVGTTEEIVDSQPAVIINATSVGMDGTSTLLKSDQLHANTTVFDLVYTPPITPLLREAERAGCRCISGTEMFIHQLCEQFRIFTGMQVDSDIVREILR